MHATLLKKLAGDDCPLVVFDVLFSRPKERAADQALAEAMRRQGRTALMADQADATHPHLLSARPTLPAQMFLRAANTNWGVAWLAPDLDLIVRKHWPFPAPGLYPSLPWTAARLAGARLPEGPQEQWLRYYGSEGAWTSLSYNFALAQVTNYFHDKIVFIGNKPETSMPGDEKDEFRTPYTRWTGASAGGVEILATAFLNLLNDEWLRRPSGWVEELLLLAAGVLLGSTLCLVRAPTACWLAAATAVAVTLAAIWLSYVGNFWFPWLVIAGGQAPCALAWALGAVVIERAAAPAPVPAPATTTVVVPGPAEAGQEVPETSDYELFNPPFGEGAFGKVWLTRNAIGQWQALKAVYQARFGENTRPYETEFKGIKRYKPISDRHPGLLRIDFVSRKKRAGYFYYVMELGDAQAAGWEENPAAYQPRSLSNMRAQSRGRRLPVPDCLQIMIPLAEALEFLHRQGLTHRDIKPSNIVFVNGRPKLADVGLVTEIRPAEQVSTWAGTAGYMPPPPEPPGTVQADVYALGMVLYVISTGRDPAFFPELWTTLVEETNKVDFIRLNGIILKACQPDHTKRYASAAEMEADLLAAQTALERGATSEQA